MKITEPWTCNMNHGIFIKNKACKRFQKALIFSPTINYIHLCSSFSIAVLWHDMSNKSMVPVRRVKLN